MHGGSADRYLIVTADDFGLDESVNEAVEQASAAGVLSAASLMVGERAAADAIRRARRLPNLRVGLHLVLADGWSSSAAADVSALADAHGRMDATMARKSFRIFGERRVRSQVEREIRAQFTAFARSGLALDHVNVHKHFHLHPTILSAVLNIGRDFGLGAVRLPAEPSWFARENGAAAATAGALLKPWVALMKWRLHARGVFCNDHLFGMAATGAMVGERVRSVIERLPRGVSEIYLHPATAADRPLSEAMGSYRHRDELDGMLDVRTRAALVATGSPLGGFRDAASVFA